MKKIDKKRIENKFCWQKSNILHKIYIYEAAKVKSNANKKRTIRRSSEIRNQEFPSKFENITKFQHVYTIIKSPYTEKLQQMPKYKKKSQKNSNNLTDISNISFKKSSICQQKIKQSLVESSLQKNLYHHSNIRTCIRSCGDSLPHIEENNVSYVDRIAKPEEKKFNHNSNQAHKKQKKRVFIPRRSTPLQIVHLQKRISKILTKYVVKSSNVSTYSKDIHEDK